MRVNVLPPTFGWVCSCCLLLFPRGCCVLRFVCGEGVCSPSVSGEKRVGVRAPTRIARTPGDEGRMANSSAVLPTDS